MEWITIEEFNKDPQDGYYWVKDKESDDDGASKPILEHYCEKWHSGGGMFASESLIKAITHVMPIKEPQDPKKSVGIKGWRVSEDFIMEGARLRDEGVVISIVEDKGLEYSVTTSGTYLNGVEMTPGENYIIKHGDIIDSKGCEDCGTTDDVALGVCPYESEINDNHDEIYLCGNCCDLRADDI